MFHISRDRIVRTSGLLALAALLATSCQGLPEPTGGYQDRTESRSANHLAEVQPGDIALLPLLNQTEEKELPLGTLRSALHRELVGRLYSPLNLDYVDGNWEEASFRGEDPPDAVLLVSVNHWSASDLVGHGDLEVGVEMRIYEGGSTTGRLLWSAQVDRRLQVITGNPPFGPVEELIDAGIGMFAREAAGAVPERDPKKVAR